MRLGCDLGRSAHTSHFDATASERKLVPLGRSGAMNKLEVAVGLEPTKVGFADRRLDRFGIATLYPNLYPKLYPKRRRNAYLHLFKSP